MNIIPRILLFGVASGLVWSLTCSAFAGFSSATETAKILVSGILSGVLVSLVLKMPLARFGRIFTFLMGLISLPLGAFFFGFVSAVLEIFVGVITGGAHDFNPFLIGLYYAAMSVTSVVALFLLPFSVLTTFILRAVICPAHRQATPTAPESP